jgi:hypothetical protein
MFEFDYPCDADDIDFSDSETNEYLDSLYNKEEIDVEPVISHSSDNNVTDTNILGDHDRNYDSEDSSTFYSMMKDKYGIDTEPVKIEKVADTDLSEISFGLCGCANACANTCAISCSNGCTSVHAN